MLGCGFRRDWVKEYTWFEYNKVEGKIYRGVCKDFLNIADKNNRSFMTGNNSFYLGNIKGHDQSCQHARFLEAIKKAKEVPATVRNSYTVQRNSCRALCDSHSTQQ